MCSAEHAPWPCKNKRGKTVRVFWYFVNNILGDIFMANTNFEGYVSRSDQFHVDPLKIVVVNRSTDEPYNFHNPRQEELTSESIADLKELIRARGGLIRPLLVFRNGDTIELRGGHRRLACIKELISEGMEFPSVPVIFDKSKNPIEQFITSIVDNQGAEPLTHLDEAYAIAHLQKSINGKPGLTVEEIAERTGWKIGTIYLRLRLLQANETVLAELKNKKITTSDVLAIVKTAKEQHVPQEVILQQLQNTPDGRTQGSGPKLKREKVHAQKASAPFSITENASDTTEANLDKENARIRENIAKYIDTIGLDTVLRYVVDHEGIELVTESLSNLGLVELAAEHVSIVVDHVEPTC